MTNKGMWKRCAGSWKALLHGEAGEQDIRRVYSIGFVLAGMGFVMVAVAVAGLIIG
ncbi:MAG: hypothetical protein V7709_07300 [Halioglobus sp.]